MINLVALRRTAEVRRWSSGTAWWGRHSCLPADRNVCPTISINLSFLGPIGRKAMSGFPQADLHHREALAHGIVMDEPGNVLCRRVYVHQVERLTQGAE